MAAAFEPLRLGIVGTGRWARQLALEIAQTPGTELVLCFDTDPDALEGFSVEFGVAAAPSLEALAADPRIEAGIACVPNASHRDVALALIAGAKHVFVPRPISNYLDGAKAMVAAAHEANAVLFVDHSSSFLPRINAMYEAARAERAGRLVGGHAFRSANWEQAEGRPSWHLSPRECPGGPATLLGVSAAATLVRFLGVPTGVRGTLASGLTASRVPDLATFLIEHESGAHSTLVTSSVSTVPNDHYYFYGTEGVILAGPTVMHEGPRAVIAEARSNLVTELEPPGRRRSGMQMFVGLLRRGLEPEATTDLAVWALATIEAGLLSVAEDRRISVLDLVEA